MERGVFETVNLGIETGRSTLTFGASAVTGQITELLQRVVTGVETEQLETTSADDGGANRIVEWL